MSNLKTIKLIERSTDETLEALTSDQLARINELVAVL
jgi:hypothetical protein